MKDESTKILLIFLLIILGVVGYDRIEKTITARTSDRFACQDYEDFKDRLGEVFAGTPYEKRFKSIDFRTCSEIQKRYK